MASLKELRNRISSITATQKITRALQMVAASKLRRSREAAENARPYADRMAEVIANLAAGVSGRRRAAHAGGHGFRQPGTGHRRRRRTLASRAASTRRSFVPRGSISTAAWPPGKQVSILTVGRKARDQLRRQSTDRASSIAVESGNGRPARRQPRRVADTVLTPALKPASIDVVTLFYNRFASVVSQVPTRRQLIPAQVGGRRAQPSTSRALLTSTSRTPRRSWPRCCRATSRRRSSPPCWRTRPAFTPRRWRRWTTPPATPATSSPASPCMKNRTRQAQITKELIEIISGAEAL